MGHPSEFSSPVEPKPLLPRLMAILILATVGMGQWASAQNNQQVELRGSAINIATSSAHAVMNISSNKNVSSIRGNNQVTSVNGVVSNLASFGAYSELNIASRNAGGGSGSQVVSITGPVISQATGPGVRNVVNIGGR